MATREQYTGDQLPYVLVGSGSGSAGDLMYLSTGTAFTVKSQANGTGVVTAFCGILEETTPAGSYGAIGFESLYQLGNLQADKVEIGQMLYVGTSSSNSVGTLDTGTAIAVCAKSAAAADSNITCKLIPFWEARANG